MLVITFLIFAVSLALLLKGSDMFVDAAAHFSETLGISKSAFAVTVVAFATSIPELGTGIVAAFQKNSNIILGNVVGSNIANIGLILGLIALFLVTKKRQREFVHETQFLLLVSIAFFLLSIDGSIAWPEAVILLLLGVLYSRHILHKGQHHHAHARLRTERSASVHRQSSNTNHLNKQWAIIAVLGLAAVYLGAQYTISSLIDVASELHMSQVVASMIFLAVGTSLPELTVSFTALKKGLRTLAVGNLIGSNIMNLLAVAGVAGLISPIIIDKASLFFTLPYMILLTILLYRYVTLKGWFSRVLEGLLLLSAYAVFLVLLVLGHML